MSSLRWAGGASLVALLAMSCTASKRNFLGHAAPSADVGTGSASGMGGMAQSASSATGLQTIAAGTGGNMSCAACSSDYHEVLDCNGNAISQCSGADGCDPKSGMCSNACQVAVANKLSVGCEYYATNMDSFSGSCFAAYVANTWNTPAHLTVEWSGQQLPLSGFAFTSQGAGQNLTYQPFDNNAGLAPGKVVILFLSGEQGQLGPGSAFCPEPTAMSTQAARLNGTGIGQSFHIVSDVPVVAYQINPYGGGSAAVTGASLLLPTSVWDTNYVAVNASDEHDIAGPSLNIIAYKDGTQVTLLPVAPVVGGSGIPSGPANQKLVFNLNKGQQAQISQQDSLTGSIVQSTQPVGFMAGHPCEHQPINVIYCDHAEQMLPPIKALGSEYVAVQYRPRKGEPAIYRLVGVVKGTHLTYSTPVGGPATLDLGQIATFITGTPFVIKSQDKDHPFILWEHMSGSNWDQGQNMDGYGDPDGVIMVPPAQYLHEYVFFADPTYPETNLVVVRARGADNNFADVTLDCAGKLANWQTVGNYEWTRIDLISHNFQPVGNCSTGNHEMKSTAPFGLWVWGWGSPETQIFTQNVSYGYPGGMNVTPINSVVIVPNPK